MVLPALSISVDAFEVALAKAVFKISPVQSFLESSQTLLNVTEIVQMWLSKRFLDVYSRCGARGIARASASAFQLFRNRLIGKQLRFLVGFQVVARVVPLMDRRQPETPVLRELC